jgi:hypothetical protein
MLSATVTRVKWELGGKDPHFSHTDVPLRVNVARQCISGTVQQLTVTVTAV